MQLRTLPAIAMLSVAGFGLTACASTLDTAKAEKAIASGIEQQTEAKNVKVDCPDNVDIKQGDTFECSVDSDSGTAKVLVTQKDDKGNIKWELNGK